MDHPALPPGVVVLEGTDLAGEWERFRVFEALHHRMSICNPMNTDDLDRLIGALEPVDGDRALDLACGHGELLIRMAERTAIDGVGVDLSPWVIARAASEAARRRHRGSLEWWVGEARSAATDRHWDIVACLGASWIWHGFDGTAKALIRRARPGARIAIGDPSLRPGVDAATVAEEYGRVLTSAEQAGVLRSLGLTAVEELPIDDTGWDDYQARIEDSAVSWSELHPGPEAERFLAEQREWRRDHDRDRDLLKWTVWTARV